ncbi:MAG: hypothetical protein DMF63_13565 [Acidobacteria bacterium]|nr:MAG: hypothetical protein DMF63_13565 [Acidobacteriota bacterium]
MKLLLILLFVVPCYSQATTSYDKFKDQTTVSAESVHIGGRLHLEVKAIQRKPDATQYYLVFRQVSRSWVFLKSHGLIFLADADRIDLGDGQHEGKTNGHYGGVTEIMIYPIQREDLETLVKSPSLEMKLGPVEAKLDEKGKKGMKDVLEYKW